MIAALRSENAMLRADFAAGRQEREELIRRMAALTRHVTDAALALPDNDAPVLHLASHVEAAPVRTQFIESTVTSVPTATLDAAPEQYWQKVQQAAGRIAGRDERAKFLQEGSRLIQQLETTLTALQIETEAIEFFETRAASYELDDILKLNQARQSIAAKNSLARQYRRDIETLLHPYSQPTGVAQMRGTLTPNIASSLDALADASRYSHLRADREIVITPKQHFLMTIHFFFTDYRSEPPQLLNVTDVFDLKAMQSSSKEFFYPEYFVKDIYELARKMWRGQGITWNRQPTTEDLQIFLTIINQ